MFASAASVFLLNFPNRSISQLVWNWVVMTELVLPKPISSLLVVLLVFIFVSKVGFLSTRTEFSLACACRIRFAARAIS